MFIIEKFTGIKTTISSIKKRDKKFIINNIIIQNARKYDVIYKCVDCNMDIKRPLYCYSDVCRECKIKNTKFIRYGDANYVNKDKAKQTKLDKYGDECYTNNEKSKKTTIEKYGVENVFQSEGVKNKIKKTNLDKYGTEYYSQSKEFIGKIRKTSIYRYGVDHYSKTKQWRENVELTNTGIFGATNAMNNIVLKEKNVKSNKESVINNIFNGDRLVDVKPLFAPEDYIDCHHTYKFLCEKCDEEFLGRIIDGLNPRCHNCYPLHSKTSALEKEVVGYLAGLGVGIVIENDRSLIKPYELDVYIPDHKLAIEFNGQYWHSDLFKEKYYHLNKTIKCRDMGIKLIHIFEDEWISNRLSMEEIITNNINNIVPNLDFIDLSKYPIIEWNGYELLDPVIRDVGNYKMYNCGFLKRI